MANLEEIRIHIKDELTPARGQRGMFVCPLCGSGTGSKKTAAFSVEKDGLHGKCFSCGWYGDLFDLIAAKDGVSVKEATRIAIERYGSMSYVALTRPAAQPHAQPATRDFHAEIEAFHRAMPGSPGEEYLHGRGITDESISRFSLGYDARRQQITIPYNKSGSYYAMRNISPSADHAHDKLAGVKAPVFNAAALYGTEPCFVVESPLCAISIMQEGGTALALGGVNIRLLQDEVQRKRPTAPLLLALDNDTPTSSGRMPGQENAAALAAWLEEKQLPWAYGNVAGDGFKDPNEALQKDPDGFRQRLRSIVDNYKNSMAISENQQFDQYMAEATAGYMEAFLNGVSESASTPPIPTGFNGLDKLLDGGLYEGLYTVGAISSLGKTSFVLQLCDQIAAAGHDVLFFSLEMGRYELMAKSISRYTWITVRDEDLPKSAAMTTRGILTGKRYEKYSQQQLGVIAKATDRYKEEVSSRIWFVEGIGNIGVAEIRSRVEQHTSITGHRPVVVVDYLQILAPPDARASDKQNTDKNVLELKRLSRDHKIPVIGISSLNRDNYTEPINTAAFKESGAIEYGSDCLIGLQYVGMEYRDGEKEQQRHQRIRELFNSNDAEARKGEGVSIEVKLLKNRNGGRGASDPLLFYPMFNFFQEYPTGHTPVNTNTPFTKRI